MSLLGSLWSQCTTNTGLSGTLDSDPLFTPMSDLITFERSEKLLEFTKLEYHWLPPTPKLRMCQRAWETHNKIFSALL